MKINYLDMIPDDVLTQMAQHHWDKLEQFCVLLTLDLHEGLRN